MTWANYHNGTGPTTSWTIFESGTGQHIRLAADGLDGLEVSRAVEVLTEHLNREANLPTMTDDELRQGFTGLGYKLTIKPERSGLREYKWVSLSRRDHTIHTTTSRALVESMSRGEAIEYLA